MATAFVLLGVLQVRVNACMAYDRLRLGFRWMSRVMKDTPELLGHSICEVFMSILPDAIAWSDDAVACAGLSGKLQAELALMSSSIVHEDDHDELALLLLSGLTGTVKSETHA